MSEQRSGPLQGVRVVELTKVWAGPYIGKMLAYLGAEVIKIESLESLDVTRSFGISDSNKAPGFQAVNPQKLSVQIDTKTKEGVELVLSLLRKSDIFVENLRPGAVKRMGLGYEDVRKVRPEIVFVSMGMYGGEGPLSHQTGYAPCFAALGGLSAAVGYEGEPPAGMNIRYADSTFGTAAAYAALVALMHRRRTGEGQFVDVSAVECMSSMIGDTMMDFALNGSVLKADGNRHAEMSPHGAYPCKDGDWISIAIASEAAWQALTEVMEWPALAAHPLFRTHADRKAHEAELDRIVSGWSTLRDARELVAELQRKGVAAAKSQSSVDLVSDPELWAREFFVEVQGADGKSRPTAGPSWRMSRSAAITRGAPLLGEHNAYVLGDLLGLPAEEQRRLAEEGITR